MGSVRESVPPSAPALSIDKISHGDVACLRFRGIVREMFYGGKLLEKLSGQKVLLDLHGLLRVSSSGVHEWMQLVEGRGNEPLYMVECSTYVVSQFNISGALQGRALVVSFYAPYRCPQCESEFEVLFVVPRDRSALRDRALPERACPTCKAQAQLDDDPRGFFAFLDKQPHYELDEEVISFLRSRYKYSLAPSTALRALRLQGKSQSYLRLSGNVEDSFPADKLAAALSGVTAAIDVGGVNSIEGPGVEKWRTFIRNALSTVQSVELVDCPAVMLERALLPEDLTDQLRIRSFALPFNCGKCRTSTDVMVDVEREHGRLTAGGAPSASCGTCGSPMVATAPESLQRILQHLPAIKDSSLKGFVARAKKLHASKLENLLGGPVAEPRTSRVLLRASFVTIGLAALILATEGIIAVRLSRQASQGAAPIGTAPQGPSADAGPPAPERPSWIVSDARASSYCHDFVNRLVCVGVSSYRPTREEALEEATDSALEELTHTIGLKITDELFRQQVLPAFNEARSAALSRLQAAELDRTAAAYKAALKNVQEARRRVTQLARESSGGLMPTQRSDWYWEEYKTQAGQGSEFLVFVRYDLSLDTMRMLVQRYSDEVNVEGMTVVTAFPSLAWRYPTFAGGVVLVKVDSALAQQGLARRSIVGAVGGEAVRDAARFATVFKAQSASDKRVKLALQSGDQTKVVDLRLHD